MTLIHGTGYSAQEKEAYREIIFSNTVQSMKVIIEAMGVMGISLDSKNERFKTAITEAPAQIESDELPHDITAAIKALWQDAGVKKCFTRSREYQLNDSSR